MLRSAAMKACLGLLVLAAALGAAELPQPVAVDPGGPGKPPSDAVVLFNGKDLSGWQQADGAPAKWTVKNGEMVCNTESGNILTKETFGSAQIHVEFATPDQREATGQARGNSGVYVQGRYEVQVLDSYNNPTYADGSASAIYKQSAPLVNASRPPEQWQTYDIIYRAPKCYGGHIIGPGSMTILHNGVLVQDHFELQGPTPGGLKEPFDPCKPGPILLQAHVHPQVAETAMRFRNLWVRKLDH
ncbi:MAG: DUF1080 domain-containing protein [Acidobacteria bacterium]|nr:DUF1080 domain-containing protein [Acidobacteriota bacterium]